MHWKKRELHCEVYDDVLENTIEIKERGLSFYFILKISNWV